MTVFKNIFNDLKLNRISYLLEVIETGNFKNKIDAYNKLKKIKIDENSGHLIIDKVMSLKHNDNDNDSFNTEISLLSLIFKNYYDSYSEHLYDAFKDLNTDTRLDILDLLANSNEVSEIILYRSLIFSYCKDLNDYPIGNISSNKDNYELIFPELFDTFNAKKTRNSLLLLLSDFVNLGVVPIVHLNKYKTVLQKLIINIFKECIKFKIDSKDNFMSNKEYINLRIFTEVAINLEYYVSNKETKSYLDKLYKTKDNQLKLFILENYSRKGKDLSKININSIAKDNLSRYPLYSFLKYNNLEILMPKKYNNNKELSLSDLYLNFIISKGYSVVPYDFELLETKIVNSYKYYIYKFKTQFNYNEEIIDPATDYLLKNIKVDEGLIKNGETTYIGISGGYNKNIDPSLIEKDIEGAKYFKYTENYQTLINDFIGEEKQVIITPEPKEEFEKDSKISKIFSFSKILTFFSIIFALSLLVLIFYISDIDLFNLKKNSNFKNTNIIHAVLLKPKDLFTEIKFNEIFNRDEPEYYVLFFKKKDKSIYYLNHLI